MKAAQFLKLLEWRIRALRQQTPVEATHPAAMSYAIGLRKLPKSKKAQGGGGEDDLFFFSPGTALAHSPFYVFTDAAAATSNTIEGRLVNDPANANSVSDKAWKAGHSASEAYGQLLDEEFGAGVAAQQAEFEHFGATWLLAPGDPPPWYFAAIELLPELKKTGAQSGTGASSPRDNVLRFLIGNASASKGISMPILSPQHSSGNLFRLMQPRAPNLDRAAFRMSPPTGAPAPAPSSSAPVLGGGLGAIAGAAAGYFLGGKSLAFAGLGAVAGGGVGYLGGTFAAKP